MIYRLKVHGLSIDEAWQILQDKNFECLYSEEDENTHALVVKGEQAPAEEWIETCEEIDLPEIDWESQWAIHSGDYRDGCAHIQVEDQTFELEPGPGFGDFSHPTTRLCLELMPGRVRNQTVIDLGCGSGILAIAAMKLGAIEAFGIDIEEQALVHAKQNAERNQIKIQLFLPPDFSVKNADVLLINMIFEEQKVALKSLKSKVKSVIASGILEADRENYLKWASANRWTLVEERVEQGWVGFVFETEVL